MATSDFPSRMRAWQYSGISGGLEKSLRLNESAQAPAPPPTGSVMVEVMSAALNPVDYKLIELPFIGGWLTRKPATPGLDFAGRVVESAEGFEKGERVFGRIQPLTQHGSLAQYAVCSSKAMMRLPNNVSFDEGACLTTAALVAYQTIVPFLPKGDNRSVFVNGGSGGVGTFSVQIAKALGCYVVASCSGANAQLVKELGADEVIDYRTTDLVTELKKKGRTFDLVVDNVGQPFDLHRACDVCVKEGGRVVQIGAEISWRGVVSLLDSMVRPRFLGGAKTPFTMTGTQDRAQDLHQLAEWAASGRIKSVIDTTFPFLDVPRAFERLKTGRARGKIVVSSADN
ncbi:putative zinc alcohol dehydrogenase [Myriangium duriaei CBS 260.36]|uniref:Zinc alcohol dehydrogenase n=1 Tax=Myriangium duriaei CBS 260.36 TaxID=1168546 RepID=A0A9P4J4Z9_9PEZI|nr:putative zinc alcohol dehydrogenase [Myriangium duriaei CBS 260.36]